MYARAGILRGIRNATLISEFISLMFINIFQSNKVHVEGRSVTFAFNILNFKWFIKFIYKNRVIEPYPKKESHRNMGSAFS